MDFHRGRGLCRAAGVTEKQLKKEFLWGAHPGLPPWAKICRPYGAGLRRTAILVLIIHLACGVFAAR